MSSTSDTLARTLRRELPAAVVKVLGGTATAIDAPLPDGAGWTITLPVSGVASGRIGIWIDAAAAAACARRLHPEITGEPDAAAVTQTLEAIGRQAAIVVEGTPEGAGLLAGEPSVEQVAAPETGSSFVVRLDDGLQIGVRLVVAVGGSTALGAERLADSRLDAVLDVDLPLVVRFGRTVMPLRNVAELSPGSVVDMGRTPDEPVELLVGDRLIARGEVVIVGGNYGVRITELTGSHRANEKEVRP